MLRTWWNTHGSMLMRIAIALMVSVSIAWLGYQFWRLLWQQDPIWPTSPSGSVDLNNRYRELHSWFAGEKGIMRPYPPASYVILWPLVGWLPFTPVKWLWAVTTVVALAWLIYLVVKESGANKTLERVFVSLMPISMYATGATIGNGQLIIHILPALLAGLLLLHMRNCTFREELLAVALIIFALVKPNASVPFLWIALFVSGRFRPALLIGLGYIAITLYALSFQELPEFKLLLPQLSESPLDILTLTIPKSLEIISNLPTNSATWAQSDRYSDLPVLLVTLGLSEWILPVTLLILAAQGLWTFRYRNRDIWLLLGVAAIVARFWTYHRWYDDLLILLPMVALFRIAKKGTSANGRDVVAGVLLAITLLATLAPGGLYLFPPPWNSLYAVGQSVIWVIVLIFLLDHARYEKNA